MRALFFFILCLTRNYSSDFFAVLNPNGLYNGQKFTKLVKIKVPDSTSKIMPRVPVTTPVKYSVINKIENSKRIVLSVCPIFFSIIDLELIDVFVEHHLTIMLQILMSGL